MKKLIAIVLLVTLVLLSLVSCTTKEGAVTDSKKFMEDVATATEEYKNNPTKENLKDVLDLVQNTDITLNDDEKKALDQGMVELSKKVELGSEDAKVLWDNNKDAVFGILEDGSKNFMDKLSKWFNEIGN